jgi:hypothetical protein
MRKLALLLFISGCSPNGVECPLVSCPNFPSVLLHIVDAKGAPVPAPPVGTGTTTLFSVDGAPVGGSCSDSNVDAGVCLTWDLTLYGMNTIHVTFPGYAAADVDTDVLGPTKGCCPGPIQVVEKTVSLTKQ